MGIGLEYKNDIAFASDGITTMEHRFTAGFVTLTDGVQFDSNTVLFRPSVALARTLTSGEDAVWAALRDHIVTQIPAGYEFLGMFHPGDFDLTVSMQVQNVYTGHLRDHMP